ncbi:MAG: hypothetical protein JSR76_04485 [Verrucomicrobia bacterium]|nr:hypothetical protein [Verrucomicrobiota bacterium]
MGCVSMDAFLRGGERLHLGGATGFTAPVQASAVSTTAFAQRAFRAHGQWFLKPIAGIPQSIQQHVLLYSPKPEAPRTDESPAGSPVSTVSGDAPPSTAVSHQTETLQPSTALVGRRISWRAQLTGIFFGFVGDHFQSLGVAPAIDRATTAAHGARTALALRWAQASDVLRTSHTRVIASFAPRLEQVTDLLRFTRGAPEALRTRCAIGLQTVLRPIVVRVLSGQPTREISPAIAPRALALAPVLIGQATADALSEPAAESLPDEVHPSHPALTNPPRLVSAGLSVGPGDELPSTGLGDVQRLPLIGRVAAVAKIGRTALAVHWTQVSDGLRALPGRAAAVSTSLLQSVGGSCRSAGTTGQAFLGRLWALATTQIRTTSAAALTRQPPASSPSPALADFSSTEGLQLEGLTELFTTPGDIALSALSPLPQSSDGTEYSPPHALSTREETPQASPPSSDSSAPERSTDVARRATPASGNPLSLTAPLSGETNPPVVPPTPLPSPLPAAPTAGTASSPVVITPSTQVTLTGLNRGVTVPIVGSVVGAVMFPIRVLETFGFTIATLFYGIKNGLTRDVAKRVDHSYGERARQSAKGVAVAAISIIPVLGPILARALLNRWVQPKAPLSR